MTRQQQPVRRRRVGEVAGNATADCAAVCCCVPCTVMDVVVLATYKVPAGLLKKAMHNKRKRRLQRLQQKRKKNEALLMEQQHKPSGPDSGIVGPTLEDHLANESPPPPDQATKLEEEMWARFSGTGFWRSSSQRHQQHEPELQTGEKDR